LYISVFASIQQEDGFSRAAATASASVVSQVLLPKASPCCFAFPLFSSSVNLATREEAKGFRGLGSATMGCPIITGSFHHQMLLHHGKHLVIWRKQTLLKTQHAQRRQAFQGCQT
jgi:hypothetical protein